MIAAIIRWSIANRFVVIVAALLLTVAGIDAVRRTPVDAIPDLSDVQVIIKTSYPGQAPQVIEDQVTYPLTTAMLAVPGAVNVRGYSFFGDSYVYVIFEDHTDLYWARSRVLEYLSQVISLLPPGAKPALGPDATGVGWIYEYALVDRTGSHDLAELRSLQDWFLKYELQTVAGVAEVATIGGMVRQYQVIVDPDRLSAYGITLAAVKRAIERGNQEAGGSVIEMGEAEYMVRASGYLENLGDLAKIPLGISKTGAPILLKDLADIRVGPQMRRGVAELNGEGEVVGGVIIMRSGENASRTIAAAQARLDELAKSLPAGVEIVTTYDRSQLIRRAVDTLQSRLIEEFIVVALVCALFLFHFRSAMVIIISLPLGILTAFIIMRLQGINANIMSLGGIAIAIGAMVDAAIVMIENVHQRAEEQPLTNENRWRIVQEACTEVGPALFFSLLIITLSFLPIFTLENQEGRLFAPLAYTKTYAMAAAAALAVTLVPVLIGLFVRGHIAPADRNPLNRWLMQAYRPVLTAIVHRPRAVIGIAVLIVITGLWPATRLGSEFMPELDEGDLLYMPSAYPGISVGKAREILQQTDRLIRTVPEVKTVFGKAGRAESATDPAPLAMIETTIQLRPRDDWRPGMTMEKLRAELNDLIQFPGLPSLWVMPIKNRIDMLATGIKTPVGIKVAGPDLEVIEQIGRQLERVVPQVPGTVSVFSERVTGGRYIDVDIDRARAARHGLNIADVQDIVSIAVGGMNITQTIEGRERYPVNLRYPQRVRDSVEQLRLLPIITPQGARIALADVAEIEVVDGPPVIKSENARTNGWTYIDIRDRDIGSYVAEAQRVVDRDIRLPPGYSLAWSGQYEYMLRARDRLAVVGPITLVIIMVLLYLCFRRVGEVLLIIATLPVALVGGAWLLYLLDYDLSVAVGVGFIALSGVAVETGVVMLLYLNQALDRQSRQSEAAGRTLHRDDIRTAILDGAVSRLRPVLMTVSTIVIGLLPIMVGGGTGAEVMRRVAAPMVGGIIGTTVLVLLLIPAIFLLWRQRGVD